MKGKAHLQLNIGICVIIIVHCIHTCTIITKVFISQYFFLVYKAVSSDTACYAS